MKKPIECFLQVDQTKNPRHRMACTVFSSAINLYWNTWIKLSQWEIDFLVEDWIKKGILSVKDWGWLEDNFMNVYSYVKKNNPQLKYKIFNKYNSLFPTLLNQGYMIRLGIKVNAKYTYDSQDNWIIESQDYEKMKGNIKHATNCLKWINTNSSETGKHFIWDSYFSKKAYNLYQVNLRNMKDSVLMENLYLFYVD